MELEQAKRLTALLSFQLGNGATHLFLVITYFYCQLNCNSRGTETLPEKKKTGLISYY